MTALSIQPTYPIFTDIDGQPLEDGYVWIGVANLAPIVNPIAVYWDAALTIPATQPVRTRGGYPVNSGTPARLYVNSDYSIQVQNKNGSVVYSAPTATERYSGVVVKVDSSDVSFQQDGSIVIRTAEDKMREIVSFDDFIPPSVDPSITNVHTYIQEAIVYGFANGKDVVGTTGKVYTIGATLLIPQNSPAPTFVKAQKFTIDGRDCIFKMAVDAPLFESAYDNGGVLTSNYGTALDSYFSVGITLTNFGVESAIGQLSQPTLKIQDWHQQCQITNITSGVSAQMMWANNCYYTTFDNISAGTLGPGRVGDRFIWFNNTNLCKISRLVGVNSVTGYRFDGPVTATVMESMSFEGMTVGVAFNATVYDIAIRDSYFEGFYDVAIAFNSYVDGAIIDNNYVNFLNLATSYFVYYAPLPGTNVTITRSNQFNAMPSNANIIKVREDVYGAAFVVERPTIAVNSVNQLRVNNAIIGRRIDWRQKASMTNLLANINNDYFVTGNYSGRFTDGWANVNGFTWVNTGANTLLIRTAITQNFVQLVYVNIEVSFNGGGPTYIAGLFIGNQFYKATGASFAPSSDLTGSTDVNGFFQIDGGYFFAGVVTGAKGEIRLI